MQKVLLIHTSSASVRPSVSKGVRPLLGEETKADGQVLMCGCANPSSLCHCEERSNLYSGKSIDLYFCILLSALDKDDKDEVST